MNTFRNPVTLENFKHLINDVAVVAAFNCHSMNSEEEEVALLVVPTLDFGLLLFVPWQWKEMKRYVKAVCEKMERAKKKLERKCIIKKGCIAM